MKGRVTCCVLSPTFIWSHAVPLSCHAVLCCAVLCCAVLCCAVLCCAVLCCVMLCLPCLLVPCHATLCHATLCPAVTCCAMICRAVRCCTMSTCLFVLFYLCIAPAVHRESVMFLPFFRTSLDAGSIHLGHTASAELAYLFKRIG